MAYSSGGLIQATDYNTFAQGGDVVTHSVANVNTLWGVGTGDKGYGQTTTLPAVASTNTVTATQWSTLISRLNSMLTHQQGSGSGIGLPAAGNTIAYLAALSSSITTATTNRLNAATNSADATGNGLVNSVWNTSTPTTFTITRTITFSSADKARYFFNAGGKIILQVGTVTNTGGTAKGTDWVSLLQTKLASITVASYSNARNGTGGTVSASNTGIGYWNSGTGGTNILTLTSASGTADYSSNSVVVNVKTNGTTGTNGDVGTVLTITLTLTDAAADTWTAPAGIPAYNPAGVAPTQGNFNDTVNITIPTTITVRAPETTNLADTWSGYTYG